MLLHLPQFGDSRIEFISLCIWLDSENEAVSRLVPEDENVFLCSKFDDSRTECFIQTYSNRDSDGDPHLHINIASPLNFPKGLPEHDDGLDAVSKHIEKFFGCVANFIFIDGKRTIIKAELPESSLPRGLLGQKAKGPKGEVLTLRAATFDISGEPYDSLEWRALRKKKGTEESFRATLGASLDDREIDEDVLIVAVETIRDGFRRIVMEAD
jgi:hypothetical protein